MSIRFSIPGPPKAQKRHKHVGKDRSGKPLPFVRTYDPSAKDKMAFRLLCEEQAPSDPHDGLVIVTFAFWMPIPKSMGGMAKLVTLNDEYDTPRDRYGKPIPLRLKFKPALAHIKRPDVDNLIKLCLDAMNDLFWVDDSRVQIAAAFKQYSHNPRTEFQITFK